MTAPQLKKYLDAANAVASADPPARATPRKHSLWSLLRPFLIATVMVCLAAATAPVLQRLPHANLSLLFLTGVLIVAMRFGFWPGIYASVLSFLAFNFFFTAPVYTFAVGETGDVATLVFFLIMASLSSNLATRLRDAMSSSALAVTRVTGLQRLAQDFAGAASERQVLDILVDHLAKQFDCVARVGTAGDVPVPGDAATGRPDHRGRSEEPEAGQVSHPDSVRWQSWTLETSRGSYGHVALEIADLTPDEAEYVAAVVSQASVALERTQLVADLEAANLEAQRVQMRAALLSSVSHDLRTPLATIIGAASSLAAYGDTLKAGDRESLLQSVLSESERLDRYIQNLLDMTRIEHGGLELQWDWEDLRDLIAAAVRRLGMSSRRISLQTDIAGDAEFIRVHGDLMEQVLVNLLDNAVRYSPEDGVVRIVARRESGDVVIDVADQGPGIPHAERERVFDVFYRVNAGDRRSGTGLGLSICRGIVRAHHGEIEVVSPAQGHGAVLRIRLPQPLQRSAVTGNG